MIRLIGQNVGATVRRPYVLLLAVVIAVVPSLMTFLGRDAWALDHWMSYASNMFDWVALLFPLLVTLLTQVVLVDECSNTYALAARARTTPARYLGAKACAAAVVSGVVFGLMATINFVVASLTFLDIGEPLYAPIETRYQLSELWATSPWLYLVTYTLWVALVAATVAVWCTLLTAVIGNKFVALAAPIVLWTVTNFGLAVLGWEAAALPPFRFHIKQQAAWLETPGWVALLVVIAGLWVLIRRRNYMTSGLVHP